ncbi:MAG: phage baseplate assembly protein V [Chloroflexi bacterium]|nr:phage baseplate assembly protein V [Chloroflexota bacterium]OJV92840.1 MAG: hypothetical protein BGO39_30260 [Chloroflexi bacterium 54-19]
MKRIEGLPQVLLFAEGVPLPGDFLSSLSEVRVQQRLSLPAMCELTFCDPPAALTAATLVAVGVKLRVEILGQLVPLFSGQVTAMEFVYGPAGQRELRVRSYDALHTLRKRQTVKAHVQVTPRELAQELVADLGLTVEAAGDGPLWPRLIQHRQTDLELLQQVTGRCGFYLAVREDTLHLLTLEGLGFPLPLVLGDSLLEARIELNADASFSSVEASGWDPSRVEIHRGRATEPRVGRVTLAETLSSTLGGEGQRELVGENAQDDNHAEGLAQADLDRRVAQEVTLQGVAQGNPGLRPGTKVAVAGVAVSVAGLYVLTSVNHIIDQRTGFISEISTLPPRPSELNPATGAAMGTVTRLDDPDGLGRVCVSLPGYQDVETGWLGVVTIGGGPGKGLVALPDVGDQVLVMLSQGDPAQGIVLGGLYGTNQPPDTGIEEGAVRRYTWQTPGGQRLTLDDNKKIIRLENSEHSYIELNPDKTLVHSEADLELEAPGHRVVVRGQKIDFERA